MNLPEKIESIIKNLPDAEGARRFYLQLSEKFPGEAKRLLKNDGLLSDVLTLAAFSPLLATTVLQNPEYISWLKRQRISTKVRGKDELLESLARFASVNSQIEPNVLLARFRRRELLRIYLRDIRNLGTIAETTEEISNLADAILEHALRLARQELDNRYGTPLEIDEKNRAGQAQICVVALGKLGSKELNYASDIDLLFLFSSDGATSGQGVRGAVTNREYFVKLAEFTTKIVGGQSGEGAAYRVDLRLRPHGRIGALAVSMSEAVEYYKNSAQVWERQVLIRSRASAGDETIYKDFFEQVETSVFSKTETVENALRNVRQSKEKINQEKLADRNFNVKLGRGGIREIEFIAQALQLAFGGNDKWLRAAHTLISVSRLADRKLISKTELTEIFEAYEFLRRLEHRLQMENGLQTHTVPSDADRQLLISKRMNFDSAERFEKALKVHSQNVNRILQRIFGTSENGQKTRAELRDEFQTSDFESQIASPETQISRQTVESDSVGKLSEALPSFAEMIAANPNLVKNLSPLENDFTEKSYREIFFSAIAGETRYKEELVVLRKLWAQFILEIAAFDVSGKISLRRAKDLQTALAEASIESALFITRNELERRFQTKIENFSLSVFGLGKLGGGGMDYGSDLDLILIYDDKNRREGFGDLNVSDAEFYSRAAEIFVTTLSSFTRDGHLYRVDLRLRPDGKNGANASAKTAFLEYLKNRSAIWEWLAYVKLRGIAGDPAQIKKIEAEARKIIHENALKTDKNELKTETLRVRVRLEEEKAGKQKKSEIDIKFGAGGMLDVYFAVRFLQLRDNVPDDAENRSTAFMLEKLYRNDSLKKQDFESLSQGYTFLSELDHNLRLAVGRSTRLPIANQAALETIVKKMNYQSTKDLFENLTLHRLNVRACFENILEN